MRSYSAALTPDPDGGFTVRFRDVPEAINEGDNREEALLRAEDALESALPTYIAAGEPLPTASGVEVSEEMVLLSALGMAKAALYDVVREQASVVPSWRVGGARTYRRSVARSTYVTLREWSRRRRRSPHSACVSSSMSPGRRDWRVGWVRAAKPIAIRETDPIALGFAPRSPSYEFTRQQPHAHRWSYLSAAARRYRRLFSGQCSSTRRAVRDHCQCRARGAHFDIDTLLEGYCRTNTKIETAQLGDRPLIDTGSNRMLTLHCAA
jgi:predicted RNase H-like HicB family nuclease